MGSGRGAGARSAMGVTCISTSGGSILTGSSLGQASLEGGQLGGGMEDSEPIGDHMMCGEGVPEWRRKKWELVVASVLQLHLQH